VAPTPASPRNPLASQRLTLIAAGTVFCALFALALATLPAHRQPADVLPGRVTAADDAAQFAQVGDAAAIAPPATITRAARRHPASVGALPQLGQHPAPASSSGSSSLGASSGSGSPGGGGAALPASTATTGSPATSTTRPASPPSSGLPDPAQVPMDSPQSQTEEELSAVCSRILGLETVPLDFGFMELGGSSLNATRTIAAIRDGFSFELPLRDLLMGKTLREIAREIDERHPTLKPGPAFGKRSERQGLLPASFSQERVWFIHRMDPANLAYHFTGTIAFNGELNREALNQALALEKKRYVCNFLIAGVYLGLGENDHAYESLEKAFRQRST